jgi:hypothetical protein
VLPGAVVVGGGVCAMVSIEFESVCELEIMSIIMKCLVVLLGRTHLLTVDDT